MTGHKLLTPVGAALTRSEVTTTRTGQAKPEGEMVFSQASITPIEADPTPDWSQVTPLIQRMATIAAGHGGEFLLDRRRRRSTHWTEIVIGASSCAQ